MGCVLCSILLTDNGSVPIYGYIEDPDTGGYYPRINLRAAQSRDIMLFDHITIDGRRFEVEHRQPFTMEFGDVVIVYTVDAQDQHHLIVNPRHG